MRSVGRSGWQAEGDIREPLIQDGVVADEIERKYLLPAESAVPLPGPARRLRQGYLALDGPVEVRLRVSDDGAVLTVKAGHGQVRTEVERPLADGEADELWPFTEGRRVEKVRHLVPLHDGLVAEVDEYEGALAGLRTVEVELPDRSRAESFVPPAWFGEELTGRPGWSNAELALRGRPG